jgi:hypothetical protein
VEGSGIASMVMIGCGLLSAVSARKRRGAGKSAAIDEIVYTVASLFYVTIASGNTSEPAALGSRRGRFS